MPSHAINILLNAKDNASPAFGRAGKAARGFGATIGSLNSVLAGFGAAFSVGAAGAFLKSSIAAFGEQELAIKQFEAALRSTGNAAQITLNEIKAIAAERQALTRFGDEATIAMASVLSTFTQIRGPEFKQAIISIQDMSALLGSDLQTAAIQVGKALNDPVKGITALQRVGVSFTQQQREQIKALVDLGNTAGAQQLILAELRKEFGGQAIADAKAMTGQIQQMKNAWGDFKEVVGEGVAPLVTGSLTHMQELLREFQGIGINPLAAAQKDSLSSATKLFADMKGANLDALRSRLQEVEQQLQDNQATEAGLRDDPLFRVSRLKKGQSAELQSIRGELQAEAERLKAEIDKAAKLRAKNTTPQAVLDAFRGSAATGLAQKFGQSAAQQFTKTATETLNGAMKDKITARLFGADNTEDMKRQAAEIMEAIRTPAEQLRIELDRVNQLVQLGFLGAGAGERAKEHFQKQFEAQGPSPAPDVIGGGGLTSRTLRRGLGFAVPGQESITAQNQNAQRDAQQVRRQQLQRLAGLQEDLRELRRDIRQNGRAAGVF